MFFGISFIKEWIFIALFHSKSSKKKLSDRCYDFYGFDAPCISYFSFLHTCKMPNTMTIMLLSFITHVIAIAIIVYPFIHCKVRYNYITSCKFITLFRDSICYFLSFIPFIHLILFTIMSICWNLNYLTFVLSWLLIWFLID